METRVSRESREVGRAASSQTTVTHTTGGQLFKTADYTMKVRDFVVNVAPAAATAIVLPPVGEARGKFYTVKATSHAYDITISAAGCRRYLGDLVLTGTGQVVVFFSDGEDWHVVFSSPGVVGVDMKQVFEDWRLPFVMSGATLNTGAIISDTAGNEMAMLCQSGNLFELHYIVGQTLMGPIWTSPGINIAMDQTDNDGVEMTMGIQTGAPCHFTIGTDAAFYFSVKLAIADVSGTDDCVVGFRKVAAYNATLGSYTDMVGLNKLGRSDPAEIYIESKLNDAGAVSEDSGDTVANGTTVTLRVNVSAAGVATFLIDGESTTNTPTGFTFDSTDEVMPFFHMLQHGDLTEALTLYEWECGYQ